MSTTSCKTLARRRSNLSGAAGKDSRAEGWQMMQAGEIAIERDLMVSARDGVLLATDVYRPEGSGPFPVLLERTPYDKSAASRSERTAADARPRSRPEVAAYFAGHSYAVAYQDCRGRYHSGGRFTKYLSEAEDGFDTLIWLPRQPWCNGCIGTFGRPMLPIHRQRSAASIRQGWRPNSSIAAASPTPTAAAFAARTARRLRSDGLEHYQ